MGRAYRTVPPLPGSPLPNRHAERIVGSQVSYFARLFHNDAELDELVVEGWLAAAELLAEEPPTSDLARAVRRAVYRALYRYATQRGWRLRGGEWIKVELTEPYLT